jgi:hypothetical protein
VTLVALDERNLRRIRRLLAAVIAALLGASGLALQQEPGPAGGTSVVGGALVASAALKDPLRVGVNALVLWSPDPDAEFAAMRRRGITAVRLDLDRALIEPSRGAYDFSETDRVFAAAERHGVQLLGILGYSPAWASSAPPEAHVPPASADDFGAWAAALADRYGGPTLLGLEVWNEPFDFGFWGPEPDVDAYVRLVRSALRAVRAAEPSTRILMAGDLLQYRSDGQQPWLAEILARAPDLVAAVDALSIHPYSDPKHLPPDAPAPRGYSFVDRVRLVHEQLERASISTPLWITEMGWCTGHPTCGAVDEAAQASNLATSFRLLERNRRWDVQRVFVYSWDRIAGTDWTERFGLHRADGSATPALEVVTRKQVRR